MIEANVLQLDRLSLKNFRCFGDCPIEFHPKLTVLVAENGQGKTAVLDAVSIALGLFVNDLSGIRQPHGFHRSDVRLSSSGAPNEMAPTLPTRFEAEGYIDGQHLKWARSLPSIGPGARISTSEARDLRSAARRLRASITERRSTEPNDIKVLPLVAFYGTGRLWSERRSSKRPWGSSQIPDERFAGYFSCLSSSSSFNEMIAWFDRMMSQIGDARFSPGWRDSVALFNTVKDATRVVLEPTGWCQLDWDPKRRGLVVGHAVHGQLPLSSLSDGVRNMVALVADVARRCASLNPHLEENAARQTPGILLIDEVDMHLHPRWQQLVVGLLQQSFRELQMILTTHSPHVLSTVDRESIRVLRIADRDVSAQTPGLQTKGVMSADVLASIMGVDPIPQVDEAVLLSRYRALIEDGEAGSVEAQGLREMVVSHFGQSHPVITDCDRLIRFQAFKLKKKRPDQ